MNGSRHSVVRTRWAALGAVIAITFGAAGTQVALADVTSGDKAVFVAVTPKRIADTRVDLGVVNRLASGVPKALKVTGTIPVAPSGTAIVVPDGATAVALNVTAVAPTTGGFVAIRPGGASGTPTTSSLNVVAGVTVPNAVTVALPTGGANAGRIQVWYQGSSSSARTHILVDVVGYYDDHTHDDRYYTAGQTRDILFDERTFVGTIDEDGTKLDSGAYTPARINPGEYTVTFEPIGVGISLDRMPPNVTATANVFCPAGTTVQAGWLSYTFEGGEISNFRLYIKTFNAAAAAADCATQFHVKFAAPTSLAIRSPRTWRPTRPASSRPTPGSSATMSPTVPSARRSNEPTPGPDPGRGQRGGGAQAGT